MNADDTRIINPRSASNALDNTREFFHFATTLLSTEPMSEAEVTTVVTAQVMVFKVSLITSFY